MTEIDKQLPLHQLKEELLKSIQNSKNSNYGTPNSCVGVTLNSPYFLTESEIEIFERTGDKIVSCKSVNEGNGFKYEIKFERPTKRMVIFEKYKTFNKALSEFIIKFQN